MKTLGWLLAGGLAISWAADATALELGVTEGVTYRATDREIEARFAPIAEQLSKALKQPVHIHVLGSYNAVRDKLRRQELDAAFIHPAHVALEAVKGGGYRTLAWTAGFTEYKVTLLCKNAAPITDWSAVSGKSFVTPDPDSITAVMTRAMLRKGGVAPESIKLQNTRFQDAVPFYVENGFATYGATAAKAVVKSWTDQGGKTCAESRPMPIKHWIGATRLDSATTAALRDALLGLSQTEAGRKALATSTYAGFVAPSEELERTLIGWLGL
jgi:ABC-type phosphate/phosphonate transport system substrate-binding protein